MAHGMASVSEALKGVKFPINKQELMQQVGNRSVQVTETHAMMMSELLQACTHETYSSITDITTCPDIERLVRAA